MGRSTGKAAAQHRFDVVGVSSRFLLCLVFGVCAVLISSGKVFAYQGIANLDASDVRPLRLGVLVPRSGDMAETSESVTAALEIARKDLQRLYAHRPVELIVKDTATDPEIAQKKLEELARAGFRIIVGPYASSEVSAVREYAEKKGLVLLSPSSTAASLAIDDNVFRLMLNDDYQAEAVAALMAYKKIACAVTIYRTDVYGNDFQNSFSKAFAKRGGVVAGNVAYDPEQFTPRDTIARMNKLLDGAVREYGADRVAVLLIAFDESVDILRAASQTGGAGRVKWFGTDGTALSSKILQDPLAAAFSFKTEFTASINNADAAQHPATPVTCILARLEKDIAARLGRSPVFDGITTYDAVILAGLATLESLANPKKDMKSLFKDVCSHSFGFSSSFDFDSNGDIAAGTFSLHKVSRGENLYTWDLVGAYHLNPQHGSVLSYKDFHANAPVKDLNIGALLPLTGGAASLGTAAHIAVRQAQSDINDFLARYYPSAPRVKVAVEDTQTDPSAALKKLRALKERENISLMVGPCTSGELQEVMDYVDDHDMLLISPTSTASSLAVNDNVFRLFLDDRRQARALATLIDHHEHRVVVPVFRDDSYGNGLLQDFREYFQGEGKELDSPLAYDTSTTDFDPVAKDLAQRVIRAVAVHGKEKVAILLIANDEAVGLFHSCMNHEFLSQISWYGADGTAKNPSILRDPQAAAFALKTRFTAGSTSFVRFPHKDRRYFFRDRLVRDFQDLMGDRLSLGAVAAYEAVWLFLYPYLHLNWDEPHFDTLRKTFITTASIASSYLGPNDLNRAGDRKLGSIGFYTMKESRTDKYWRNSAECFFSPVPRFKEY